MKDIKILKEKIVCRKIDDEMVLVPLVNGVAEMKLIYTLNDVGAFIWENIDTHDNVDTLAQAVTENFDTDISTAKNDIEAFLAEIKETFTV